jgi:hypothetical protein
VDLFLLVQSQRYKLQNFHLHIYEEKLLPSDFVLNYQCKGKGLSSAFFTPFFLALTVSVGVQCNGAPRRKGTLERREMTFPRRL